MQEIHNWINSCIEELRDQYKLPFEKIILTESWFNKSIKNGKHHLHTHPSSLISGILYLTSHETGPTVFRIKDPWKKTDLIAIDGQYKYVYVKPVAGKLILFPSNLIHSVDPFSEEGERYTLAFNAFPEGNIGYFAAGLKIKIEGNAKSYKTYLDNINLSFREYVVP
jgi:uncharacterized protein (TIGR02466 family)